MIWTIHFVCPNYSFVRTREGSDSQGKYVALWLLHMVGLCIREGWADYKLWSVGATFTLLQWLSFITGLAASATYFAAQDQTGSHLLLRPMHPVCTNSGHPERICWELSQLCTGGLGRPTTALDERKSSQETFEPCRVCRHAHYNPLCCTTNTLESQWSLDSRSSVSAEK